MMFEDRVNAGRRLAEALLEYRDVPNAIVLGIPRGGVVVAAEVASQLGLPLDIAVAAKVGAPGNPEYAVGAVAPDGEVTLNPGAGMAREEVQAIAQPARDKVKRYMDELRRGRPPLDVSGLTVLLVDDGLATGLTAMSAVEWLRRQGASEVILAVPVASDSAIAALERIADEVIAVAVPPQFFAVGQFYRRFEQTEDDEVLELLTSTAHKEAYS